MSDPYEDITKICDIMDHIKLFENFYQNQNIKPWYTKGGVKGGEPLNRKNFTRPTDIKTKLGRLGIEKYKIKDDGSVDINQDVLFVDLAQLGLVINIVEGEYHITNNGVYLKNLTNGIRTHLTDKTLKGSPKEVTSFFFCANIGLTSLEGCPEIVGGSFHCGDNNITSLEGCPEVVGGSFECEKNDITSFEGSPRKIGGRFNCERNNIMTFEGAPESVISFTCRYNPINNIWKLFQDYSKIELLNDYDALRVIKNNRGNYRPVVVLDRLNEFLMSIGKEPVEKVNGYKNI